MLLKHLGIYLCIGHNTEERLFIKSCLFAALNLVLVPLEFGSYRIKNFDLDGGKLILSHKENSCKDGNKNKNKNNYLSCKKECNKRYRVTKLSKVGLKMTLTKL